MLLRASPLEQQTVSQAVVAAHEYLQEREQSLARRIVSEYADWYKRSHRRTR